MSLFPFPDGKSTASSAREKKKQSGFSCRDLFRHPEKKRRALSLATGLAITLFCGGLLFFNPPVLDRVENNLLDHRFRIRGPLPASAPVLIAAIDEKSLARLGRWPWNREVMARLVDRLAEARAKIIAWDVFFTEPEENDARLAASLYEAGNVLLPMVMDFDHSPAPATSPVLPASAITALEHPQAFALYPPIEAHQVILPVNMLSEDARGLGHISMFPDKDGTLRWEALLIAHDGYLYPSLGLRAAAEFLDIPIKSITVEATRAIRMPGRRIPTDPWGRTLINYYGPNRTFPQVSVSDILEKNLPDTLIAGKIILIGATAAGIYDLRVTPYSAAMPGVEKHASVIAAILEDRPLTTASFACNLGILFFSGLGLTLAMARFRSIQALSSLALALILGLTAGASLVFIHKGLWLNLTCPLITVLLLYTAGTALHYGLEERHSRRIRAMFSSYVTERVVNELILHPEMARLGGIRREVSVLFSDVRGFTSFSEKHSPEEVVAILNEYLGEMTRAVFRWEGTLDKFIGDAIMVFWNAPMIQPDHAGLAVHCALDMARTLEKLREKWKKEGKPLLDCGIGINTGEVLVGNIGAEGQKMDYTVIGDHVNLGARLESLTKKYEARILISGYTLESIRPMIERGDFTGLRAIGRERVIVKGKEEPVTLYELREDTDGLPARILPCPTERVVRMTEK